ncbi:regulator of protease activity HflC (stomatin/prohibitin superfamily) [Catenuloplanes nepalensis]|uniref:Regulator of protease activity HflC (Stomatin/prohibitin superfamily) n=1 Tax=Catenuloplanes nepalensis TaxID=587533 RepID=A0ABT9MUM1_9ACTN|nr:SPFH domain-containing protein [Catenuloplanes nepalensis]MDP9794956.1 regulator of protease activity HflC (stomatin/prohibitin superfamily) [Catenuloplanes nepalensis]
MADVTRRFHLRHLRSAPTSWVSHTVRGRVRRTGTGLSFWYRPLTAALSEVPVDDRELPLLFHARTEDFADVTVQATVTYRVSDPLRAAERLDFSIDPYKGVWRGQPLDQVAGMLAELAQQPALDLLARMPLATALTTGIATIRTAVADALADDPRLTETGVSVVSARVVALRPEPEMERALQTPTREQVQQDADRATYARRAHAVQQEQSIAENELQSRIELARREQQLVEQRGANTRREAELEAERDDVASAAQADRLRRSATAEADAARVRDEARAAGTRLVGLAEAEAEAARLAAYRDLPPGVLQALAVKELAGQLPAINELTVTPDLLSKVLGRLS